MFNLLSRRHVQSTIKMSSPIWRRGAKRSPRQIGRENADSAAPVKLMPYHRCIRWLPDTPMPPHRCIWSCMLSQVRKTQWHQFNRRVRNRHWCNRRTIVQRRCQARSSQAFSTGRTDGHRSNASVQCHQQRRIKSNGYEKIK